MENFDEYVRSRGAALLRFAYLLCGDAHRAEDFTQEALVRCHRRWRRITGSTGPDAYVRKAILRQYLSWRRRRSAAEQVLDHFDDRTTADDSARIFDDRDAMRQLLARLPRRQRAVLVLRFYEDLPDEQIAELLGCAMSTVRVHASRALTALRDRPELLETFHITREPA